MLSDFLKSAKEIFLREQTQVFSSGYLQALGSALLIGLVLQTLWRTAWLSDDAAITFRVVLNTLEGWGPVFNLDERVQAYTHPLWYGLLTLVAWVSGDIFHGALWLGALTTVFALVLLAQSAWRASGGLAVWTVVLLWMLSPSWVSFSTSGLENPLTHLLISALVILFVLREAPEPWRIVGSGLLLGLSPLVRPDLPVLLLPLGVVVFGGLMRSHACTRLVALFVAAAVLPLALWTAFSMVYYGSPVPNTAYAKLNAGIDSSALAEQGLRYIIHHVDRDPILIFSIVGGLAFSVYLSIKKPQPWIWASLGLGMILHLLYVIRIGGDFMEGRFLTPSAWMGLVMITVGLGSLQLPFRLSVLVVTLALGFHHLNRTVLSPETLSPPKPEEVRWGIVDERAWYFQTTGLVSPRQQIYQVFPTLPWVKRDTGIEVFCGGLGFNSIYKGPGVHLVDSCALADPLLARLPSRHLEGWRIGHFEREVPAGYIDSIRQNQNLLQEERLKSLYDDVRLRTRAPIGDPHRLRTIFWITRTP